MDGLSLLQWVEAAVPPLTFLLLLWLLLESKYSRRVTLGATAALLVALPVIQGVVLALGQSQELCFTLLPLTLYFPAIVCLHLLSKRPFLPTALTWLSALLCSHLLMALRKLVNFLHASLDGMGLAWGPAALLLLAAGALLVLMFRLRPSFLTCMAELEHDWLPLLFLPLMLLALYSYFLSSTTNVTVLLLLFFTALAAFLVMARLTEALAEEHRSRQARLQMDALRRDCQVLQKKLELGRTYRHDMRHHMTVLTALLEQGDCDGARRYVADWQGQLSQIGSETWCRNTAVNGVLSAYLSHARDAGCTLDVEVTLPEPLPVEEIDLCVVLANALENAIHACQAAPEGAPRHIRLSVILTDHRRLTVCVENSCHQAVTFDENGLPVVPRREGHGQGLRSIAAVAEKYHGLLQCSYAEGVFTLRVALLDGAPEPLPIRRAPAVCAGVFLCLFLLNCMPTLAQSLETVPLLGPVVQIVDLRSYSLGWGDTALSIQAPVLEGDEAAVDELAAQMEDFIARMETQFIAYAARKYQGYVAEDISYDVVRDDETLFILRFSATLNAGGSVDYSHYVVLDKGAGQVLTLADLFSPDSNYIFPISREIKAQMAEQMNAGEANYFLPGGIWSDDECFQSIDGDQNFYIDEDGHLVIVFAEYEVAPGSMGTPEFVIPTDVLDGLLLQPSILR